MYILRLRVIIATILICNLLLQIFSKSVAVGLKRYLDNGYAQFKGCEGTIEFCQHMNDIFDALNRKHPNEGLTPQSNDERY